MTERCRAVQYSDEMHCAKCGLRWDVNDPEPPECPRQRATRDRELYKDRPSRAEKDR